jgi:cardiolipin synthase A/B
VAKLARLLLPALLLAAPGCTWLHREKRIREPVRADYAVADAEFRISAQELLGAPIVGGNAVAELVNGDRIFPAMLEAIRGAKKTITLEMFIWSSGQASEPFLEALSERARAGIKVHVLLDAVGSLKLKKKDVARMTSAGVQVVKYNPPLARFLRRANHRTHRKILVVDGRVGFTGGVCIQDRWLGDAQPGHWRDTMVRVEGPVVRQMQAVFVDNWVKARSEVLHGEEYLPEVPAAGEMRAQFVASGPHEDVEKARFGFLLAIAAARKTIRIAHSYFAPDTLMIDALADARRRGVRVEILVPAKSDNLAVQKASMPRWRKVLAAGAEFHEYSPTLFHPKIMIVDGLWSIVGSTNFDDRSLKLNDEADLHVLDAGFAAQLLRTFESDKAKSRPLSEKDLKKRNIVSRALDHFFGLFRAQL